MSEMVERIARVLCGSSAPDEEPWNSLGLREQQDYRRIARDAIEAMREPTDPMIHAGVTNDHDGPCQSWRAMIDAALAKDVV